MASQKRIAGGAMVLAVMQFGASLAGLFRDRILSSTFPVGIEQLDVVSVYISAFRPSDLLFQMFVMSAFSVALVPLLAGHLAHGREDEMNKLLTSVLIIASVLFGIISLILAIFLESLAPYFVNFTGKSLELYIHFGRLACFTNMLFVFGNAFGQYLISRQTYFAYGLTPILYTLGTIAGTIYLTPIVGPYGPIYGTLIGALIYVVVRCGACVMGSHSFQFVFMPFFNPELKTIGILMLPRMVALGAMQLQLLLFDKVASGLPLGSVTINAYARNFQAAAVGILGIALAQSAYSLLSQAIAKGEIQRFHMYLRKGVLLALGLTIPAAIALVFLAPLAAWIVHLTEPTVVKTFVVALGLYAISVPFESLNHLLLRASYATKHTITPAVLSVINGVIAITAAWVYGPVYGVYALALGFAVGQIVQVLGLWVFLRVRVRRLS